MASIGQGNYKIEAYNTSGVKQFEINDFAWLSLKKTVNLPGLLTFGLRGNHPLLSSIGDKWELVVYRKAPGQDWALELATLYRDIDWSWGDGGQAAILYCPGIMQVLGWRVIAYPAGVADLSKFTGEQAETISKTLVDYNLRSNASTTNGRIYSGVLSYPTITLETDASGGNTVDFYCSNDVLLDALYKLSKVGGGDYSLYRSSAGSYQFKYHAGQLGADKTDDVIFALDRHNMREPFYRVRYSPEASNAIVGGKGEGLARDFIAVQSSRYNATSNKIELFVNATDIDEGDTDGLTDRGNEALAQKSYKEEFGYTVIQAPSTQYSIDYELGDLVTVINPFTGASYEQKITSVALAIDATGKENISIEVSNK